MTAPVWFDLDEGEGVLELYDPDLDLHVRIDEDGRTLAWWMTEGGRWLGAASVGEA